MAVRLIDYYKAHQRRVIWATTSMLTAINITLVIFFKLIGISWLEMVIFLFLPLVTLQVFAMVIILRYAMEPLEVLSKTIAHVSNEPNVITPPNINLPRYERSGLKKLLQVIYTRNSTKTPAQDNPVNEVLDTLPCGIVLLSSSGEILNYNKQAPVVVDSQQKVTLTLHFPESNSLSSWLSDAIETKVNDKHFWPRIQDKLPGEDGRKVYDVVAHYEKNAPSGADTVLVTVDQTERYGEDEEGIDFLSIAAHEIRGPITVIRGYMDVLRTELDSFLQPDQRLLMERLDVSASRLNSYVNNILSVAKYDRRHLKLHLHEESMANVYLSIATDLDLRARTTARILSVNIPHDLPTIAADRSSLGEVIANLADNAIKYSREGGQVVISAQTEGNYVRFSVQDFGVGIPASVAQNLFQKFYRSHRSRSTVAGTGLGLFISRAIIESHGGQIRATSTEGQGSTFSFTVPIYATVADKLKASNNANEGIIQTSSGWIRNHSKIGG